MTPRKCPKCKRVCTEDDFPKRSDGRPRRECKICYNGHRKQSRTKKEKRCTECLEWKPVSEFVKNTSFADGYVSRCKSCEAERETQGHVERIARIAALHVNVGSRCPKCGDELILDDDEQSVWCRKCGFRHYRSQGNPDPSLLKDACRKMNTPNQYNVIGMMVCECCGRSFEGSNTRTRCSDCAHKRKRYQEVA